MSTPLMAVPSEVPASGPAGVRIVDVERRPLREPLAGYSLDRPRGDGAVDGYDFVLQGWVTSATSPPTALELVAGRRVLARVGIDVRRRDIADLFPDIEWAANSGFRTRISVLRLPNEFELEVRVVLQDSSHHVLGTIRGSWRFPPVRTQDHLQPVLLTTLGRTGSTWTTRLLGEHPEILAYRPFEYEPRLASYWLEVLGGLSDPHSYGQALRGDLEGGAWWLGRRDSGRAAPDVDAPMARWLGTTQVEALLPFSLGRIDDFYREAARQQGGNRTAFFVEKYLPDSIAPDLIWALYPRTAEVILVRDFRDMIASIFAYNRKRGMEGFGRAQAGNDAQYIGHLRGSGVELLERWRYRAGQAFLLRYEDLVLEPETTLAALFEHIGVDHDDATVQAVLDSARNATPEAQRQHATTSDPAASIGRWRRDLDDELQEVAAREFGDLLDGFGYEV